MRGAVSTEDPTKDKIVTTRKTFEVRTFISRVNGMMAAPSPSAEARMHVQHLAESILHDTGNYRGFQYILPGGEQMPTEQVQRGNYDKTRVRYLLPRDGKTTGAEKTAETRGREVAENKSRRMTNA